MKKNLNRIFPSLMMLTVILCSLNITVSYISLNNNVSTSFPPETAFIYIIPYSFVIFIIGALWLITHFITNKKK